MAYAGETVPPIPPIPTLPVPSSVGAGVGGDAVVSAALCLR